LCCLVGLRVHANEADHAFIIALATTSGNNITVAAEESFEMRLVGLIVDGNEVDTLEVIFVHETYYLPVEPIADHTGASLSSGKSALLFETPGGSASIAGDQLFHHDAVVFISRETLRERLVIESRFDSSRYAVVLDLPWWRSPDGQSRAPPQQPTPDRLPPRASLSQLRVDYNYTRFDEVDRHLMDYRFDGALLDGGWRVDVSQDFDQDTYLREYYWLQAQEHSQVLVGRQDALLHPLFPSADFSGGQMLLSNRPLNPVLSYAITRSDFARSLARPQQDLRGRAKAGSIAELRVEGRIVARQRVRLDGAFEFLDVTFPSRGYSQVEVFVLDGSTRTLLETQDFSRTASQLMLDNGHQVALFGAGAAGNIADPEEHKDGGVGIAQWRAGISDTLTLEAAYLGADGVSTAQLGVVRGLGKRWVSSLGLVADDGGTGGMAEVFGYGERWNLEYLGRETEDGYRESPAASLHDLRYRFYANPQVTWGGRARYSDGLTGGDNFVLPGVSWRPNQWTSLSAWPNIDGDYRLDADYRPNPSTQVSYSYESDSHRLFVSRYQPSGVEYYFESRSRGDMDARFESGMRWSSLRDVRSRFELAGISTQSGDLGYYVRAEKTFYPGFYGSLELRDEPALKSNDIEGYDPGLTMQMRFTMDYSLTNGRFVPASKAANDTTTGSIAGSFRVEGGLPIPPGLEKVTLLIDGLPRSVPSRDGRFHIGGLKPGLYRVRLDQQSLPIELVPTGESLWVKVSHAAVTQVDFWTELQFGVAGRIIREDGSYVARSKLWILDEDGNTRVSTYTDQFGLYRADGLTPGRYRVEAVGDDAETVAAATEFTISNDFLFGIDLTLPEPAQI
jgi:hypothetical protein